MSIPSPLVVKDAPSADSIWRDGGEKIFRENVAKLQKASDNKPGDPKVYSQSDWQGRIQGKIQNNYTLPFDVEQRIADDLAFMVADKGEAKTVSAVTLEEKLASEGLTIRLATNNGVNQRTVAVLKAIFGAIEQCASRGILNLNITRYYDS